MKRILLLLFILLHLTSWGQIKPELKVQTGHSRRIRHVILVDKTRLLTASRDLQDKSIRLWHLPTGKEIRTFRGHKGGWVDHMYLLKDKRTVLSEESSRQVIQWNLNTSKIIRTYAKYGSADMVLFADQQTILLPQEKKLVRIEIATGKTIQSYAYQSSRGISKVQLLPNQKRFFAIDKDGKSLRLMDVATGKSLWNLSVAKRIKKIKEIDEEYFLTYGNAQITIWKLATGKKVRSFAIKHKRLSYTLDDIVVLPNTQYLLTQDSSDETIRMWNYKTGKSVHVFEGHTKDVDALLLLPDKRRFLTGSQDNTIKLWDTKSRKLIRTYSGHTFWPRELKLLPDGKTFLSRAGGKDATVRLWNLKNGQLLRTFQHDKTDVPKNIIFLKEPNSFLTLCFNGAFIQWNLQSEQPTKEFRGYTRNIKDLIVTDDSRRINLVGDRYDYTIKQFDLTKGQINWVQNSEGKYLRQMKYLPSIQSLLGFVDDHVKIWNATTGLFKYELGENKIGVKKYWKLSGTTLLTIERNTEKKYVANFWNISNGKKYRSYALNGLSYLKKFFLVDDQTKILAGYRSQFQLTDLRTGKLLKVFKHEGHRSAYPSLLPGKRVLRTGARNIQRFWDMKSGKLLSELITKRRASFTKFMSSGFYFYRTKRQNPWVLRHVSKSKDIKEFAYFNRNTFHRAPDHRSFLIANQNKIEHWELKNNKAILKRTFQKHTANIIRLQYDRDGKTYISVDKNKQVIHWNLSTGKVINTYVGDIFTYIIRRNGLFIYERPNVVKYYDLTGSNFQSKLVQQTKGGVRNLKYLPWKNQFLIKKYNTVEHWDFNKGKVVGVFGGQQQGRVKKIILLGDSTRAALVNEYNSVTLVDLKKNQEILTIFTKAGDYTDFLALTPEGYYLTTKAGAKDLVHYVAGNKVFFFDQFDLRYNRPDKVLETIGMASKLQVKMLRRAYIKRLQKAGFSKKRIDLFLKGDFDKDFNAPEIIRKGKGDGGSFIQTNAPKYKIQFAAIDKKYPLDRYNIFVNGVSLYGRNGVSVLKTNSKALEKTVEVPLSKGKNVIEIAALNTEAVESLKERIEVNYIPKNTTSKPNLHIVALGVSKYKNQDFNLNYARKDAQDITKAFQNNAQSKEGNKRFGKVTIHELHDKDLTHAKVKALKQQLLKTKVDDHVIVFYAGHGLLDEKLDYYLGTHQVNFENPSEGGLAYEDLESIIDGIPARQKLLLVDACHSGEVDKDNYEEVKAKVESKKVKFRGFPKTQTNQTKTQQKTRQQNRVKIGLQNSYELMKSLFTDLRKSTGSTVLSSAGGGEFALESEEWNNGVFTYSLLDGLKNLKADLNKDGKVMLSECIHSAKYTFDK